MEVLTGDILIMKKAHPCGEKRWKVLGIVGDVYVQCLGCGHRTTVPMIKLKKNIREIIRDDSSS